MGSEAIRDIPEAGYYTALRRYKLPVEGMSHIAKEPWVNYFVAKETPIRFQIRFASHASRGWHLQWHQKIVCVGVLAPA